MTPTERHDHQNAELYRAALRDDLDALLRWMPYADPQWTCSIKQMTALSAAAFKGSKHVLPELLKVFSPTHTDKYGQTPFLIAAEKGHFSVLKLLAPFSDVGQVDCYGRGAVDLISNIPGDAGKMALEWLFSLGLQGQALLVNDSGATPLMTACVRGGCVRGRCASPPDNLANITLRTLLPHSDVNAQDNDGHTALMTAIIMEFSSGVAFLAPLSDLSLRDKDGLDALELAVSLGRWSCVDILAPFFQDTARVRIILNDAPHGALPKALAWVEARELSRLVSGALRESVLSNCPDSTANAAQALARRAPRSL